MNDCFDELEKLLAKRKRVLFTQLSTHYNDREQQVSQTSQAVRNNLDSVHSLLSFTDEAMKETDPISFLLVSILISPTLQHSTRVVLILTLNGPWYDFVPVSFCKLLNKPADRMVKKTLEYKIFRRFYIALHAFLRNIDTLSPKSRKRDEKISADLPVFCFWPFYPTGIKIELEHAECNQRHDACKVLSSSPAVQKSN